MKTEYDHNEVTHLLNSMEAVANDIRELCNSFHDSIESETKKAA